MFELDKLIIIGIVVYLCVINVIACVMYYLDKQKAIKGAWRTPESALIGVAALGGSVGALIGMKVFRHKTKHLKFTIGVPLILIIQVIIGVVVLINYL